ncbi:MAG: hypothetical protein HYZ93_04395 [Candidatus Omnitrophica bacterium]|nr:hypothetical protein [Candidatus Omnitrophota bacterium]
MALLLTLGLALPGPAFGLRPAGLEEADPKAKEDLADALHPPAAGQRPVVRPPSAEAAKAGLEEGEKLLHENPNASYNEVILALLNHDRDYSITRLAFFPKTGDRRNLYRTTDPENPPAGWDFSNLFILEAKGAAGDAARNGRYSIRIIQNHRNRPGEVYAEVTLLPAAGLEEKVRLSPEEFIGRYPEQAGPAREVPGATDFLVIPEELAVRFYRPETLAAGLEEFVAAEKKRWGIESAGIALLPYPADPKETGIPSLFFEDALLGLPYRPSAPVIRLWNGRPFEHSLPKLIAAALLGRLDAAAAQVLTLWEFESAGRRFLALAVQA